MSVWSFIQQRVFRLFCSYCLFHAVVSALFHGIVFAFCTDVAHPLLIAREATTPSFLEGKVTRELSATTHGLTIAPNIALKKNDTHRHSQFVIIWITKT